MTLQTWPEWTNKSKNYFSRMVFLSRDIDLDLILPFTSYSHLVFDRREHWMKKITFFCSSQFRFWISVQMWHVSYRSFQTFSSSLASFQIVERFSSQVWMEWNKSFFNVACLSTKCFFESNLLTEDETELKSCNNNDDMKLVDRSCENAKLNPFLQS